MNLNDYSLVQNLTEAYLDVYEQEEVLDEVRGGGRIDPVSDIPGIGERGARSPKDAGLLMSPLDRAKARANALTKKGNTKQANLINSRFVKPTERAVNRALLAAANAKHAEKTRLMNPQESYDLYDLVLSHLLDEGYADTEESALQIMASMSEEWRESIVEETLDERRNVTDRPLGIMHRFGRGVRTPKGEKTELMGSDREGNPTGKYLRMKHEKKAAQRENDADEQRRRDRDAMGRGTWDKD